jgi:hypothetical protein
MIEIHVSQLRQMQGVDCDDLVLTARCHPRAGTHVGLFDDGLRLGVMYHGCGRPAIVLVREGAFDASNLTLMTHLPDCPCPDGDHDFVKLPHAPCHPGDPVDLLYQKTRDALSLRCKTCKAIGTIGLDALD